MNRPRVAIRESIWITAIGLILFAHSFGFAQAVNNAQIHGVVQDPSGAAIVGAEVKATQTDTGRVQTTASAADGRYVLPGLPVGAYSLQVTAPTFRKYIQTGILLEVGQNVEVDIPLTVGAVSQEVHVSADAAMVETQDTSVGEVVDQQRIVDLPLNGRQVTDLIVQSGGAAAPPNGASRVVTTHDYANSVAISVSGGQINGNNYLLDGGDNNDSHSNVNMPFPFPDALQEYSVQTNGISSRFGLHPGSVINVVTKSGTNSFHGGLFEFVRNGDLDANNYFSATQDTLHRNQFGGYVGGPIRKDKIFVFGGYQNTIIRQVTGSTTSFVPTQAVLNGDFSTIDGAGCETNGKAKQLINPATNTPYPNDFINPATFTKPSLALAALIPISTNPNGCGKLVYPASNPSNEYQYVSKMDWNQSAKNTVQARYFILDYGNPAVYTNNILTTTRPSLLQRSQSLELGDQFTISPTLINSFHFTYSRLAVHRSSPNGMPSPNALGVNMYDAVTNFLYLTVTNYFAVGGGSNAPAKFIRNQYQWADDIDYIKGRHHLSFGAENIIGTMYQNNIYNSNGYFLFGGSLTGDNLADFMTGNVSTFQDTISQITNAHEKYLGLYAEDSIQVTKGLNVHAGVRWEPSLPEVDQYNEGSSFSQTAFAAGQKSTVFTNAPPGLFFYGDKGIPKGFANGSYDDFAPRVGVAWDPTGKGTQSIRSSYGIFFDTPETFTDSAFGVAPPWGNGLSLTNPGGGFVNPYATYAGGDPFPSPYPPQANATFNQAGTYINLPLGLHHMYMQQWDLSYEHQLGNDWVVTASYIGNKATHLRTGSESNPAIYIPGTSTGPGSCGSLTVVPANGKACSSTSNTQARRLLNTINPTAGAYYSTITFMNDSVNTNYNAARLSAQHRISHGYTWLMVYTYSHCLQDAEPLSNKLSGNNQTNPYNMRFDYGPCDYDLRHNLVSTFVYQGFNFANRKLNLIAGGWSPALLVSYYNGFPFTPVTGVDNSLSGVGLDRPNSVAGVSPYLRNHATRQWVNAAAFTPNPLGTFGDTGMNSLLGPHYVDTDVNMSKLFKIHEQQTLQMRFEFFNIFNHPNLQAPVVTESSSTFGQIQAANPPRIIQLAAKYTF